MSKRVGMESSLGLAEAVRLCDVDVIAAYPITPQTHIVEKLSEMVAEGELDAEYICVESEHSAMSACLGASATGARVFTATAGQGLELMHEVMYVASAMRFPIVMVVANRALSSPLSVWGDHSDVMAVRDTGWIQIFCENGQEAIDNTIIAFRIAEALRSAGFAIHLHCGGGSFKSQMKKADASGAPLALIVGDDETAANAVSVKPLRTGFDQPAEQVRVSFDELADHLGDILFPMEDDNGNL